MTRRACFFFFAPGALGRAAGVSPVLAASRTRMRVSRMPARAANAGRGARGKHRRHALSLPHPGAFARVTRHAPRSRLAHTTCRPHTHNNSPQRRAPRQPPQSCTRRRRWSRARPPRWRPRQRNRAASAPLRRRRRRRWRGGVCRLPLGGEERGGRARGGLGKCERRPQSERALLLRRRKNDPPPRSCDRDVPRSSTVAAHLEDRLPRLTKKKNHFLFTHEHTAQVFGS